MKFLVIGCGSIGERHISNIRSALPDASIDAFDPQPERVSHVSKKYAANPVPEEKIDSAYDCVFVCTPPVSHVGLARRALDSGSNVFIEKPLSSSLKGAAGLEKLASRKRLLAFVGYNFRFNRGINAVKQAIGSGKLGRVCHASAYFGQYLPDWRPWQDYTKSYTARKDLGGGIIHDGSHEIDYLVWLLGRPTHIQCQFAFTDILSADTEAISDILVRFGKNVLGHVHLDFVRREYRRSLEVLCENGIVQWSLSEDAVKTYDPAKKSWSVLKLDENVNDMYRAEMSHVIECIKRKERSDTIDLKNGLQTLALSDAAHRSGRSGKRLPL
jgi:predicted dehydrogenase